MSSKTKPSTNVDTAQMEQMRAQVVEQELSARSWKAYYEKMYFSIEAEKLEPAYAEYKKRLEDKLAEQKKAYEEFIKIMQDKANINGENSLGDLNVSEAPVIKMNDNG